MHHVARVSEYDPTSGYTLFGYTILGSICNIVDLSMLLATQLLSGKRMRTGFIPAKLVESGKAAFGPVVAKATLCLGSLNGGHGSSARRMVPMRS